MISSYDAPGRKMTGGFPATSPSHHLPFLDVYRSSLFLLIYVSILASDFHVYPPILRQNRTGRLQAGGSGGGLASLHARSAPPRGSALASPALAALGSLRYLALTVGYHGGHGQGRAHASPPPRTSEWGGGRRPGGVPCGDVPWAVGVRRGRAPGMRGRRAVRHAGALHRRRGRSRGPPRGARLHRPLCRGGRSAGALLSLGFHLDVSRRSTNLPLVV